MTVVICKSLNCIAAWQPSAPVTGAGNETRGSHGIGQATVRDPMNIFLDFESFSFAPHVTESFDRDRTIAQ